MPQQDVDELAGVVATRQRERNEQPSPSAFELSDNELAAETVRRAAFAEHRPWPLVALERLRAATTETTRRWSIVMDYCAKNPGTLVSTEDIARDTELTVEEWRTACRRIPPHLKKHYPDVPVWGPGKLEGEAELPLVAVSGRRLKVKDQLYVGITQEQADRWAKSRG